MTSHKRGAHPRAVFLHGLGGSRHDWDDVVAKLDGAVHATVLDLPGSAGHARPVTHYDPASLAKAVLADLPHGAAVLVGHSQGARVAGEIAVLSPGHVSALVLVSPLAASPYSLMEKLKWKGMSRRAVLTSVPEAQMRRATGYGFAKDGRGKAGFVERAMASRTGPHADATARAVEHVVDGILDAPPLAERLKGTTMPLLVLSGAEDPLAPPAKSKAILKARHDAHFVEMPGIGHYPMLEDPAGFAKALKAFLSSL